MSQIVTSRLSETKESNMVPDILTIYDDEIIRPARRPGGGGIGC